MPAGNPVKQELAVDEFGPAHLGVCEAGDHFLALEYHDAARGHGCLVVISRVLERWQKPPVCPILLAQIRRVFNDAQNGEQVQYLAHPHETIRRKSLRNPEFAASNERQPVLEDMEPVAQAEENTAAQWKAFQITGYPGVGHHDKRNRLTGQPQLARRFISDDSRHAKSKEDIGAARLRLADKP